MMDAIYQREEEQEDALEEKIVLRSMEAFTARLGIRLGSDGPSFFSGVPAPDQTVSTRSSTAFLET